jgi:hypothetical protein
VKPSKIMQQDEVLSELFDYASRDVPDKTAAVQASEYLKACSGIFEHGFLCSEPVRSIDSPVVKSILKGYKYFENWCIENDVS